MATAKTKPGSNLYRALMVARSNFGAIVRDKENRDIQKDGGRYRYVSLDSILHAITEPLADQDLILTQTFGEGPCLTTILHYAPDGTNLTSSLPLAMTGSMQDVGTRITYLRRYSIVSLLCLAVDEDTDAVGDKGVVAGAKVASPSNVLEQAKKALFAANTFEELLAKINSVGEGRDRFSSEEDYRAALGVARIKAEGYPKTESTVLIGTADSYLGRCPLPCNM